MYFDAAATTPLHPEVKQEMIDLMDIWGNENSKHDKGFEARKKMDEYLSRIAKVLSVSPDQLAVTYSGTDSNRKVVWAARKMFGEGSLYCSAVEHSSLADEVPEENYFHPHTFQSLPEQPKFISLMRANAETGAIYDLASLRQRYPQALIHTDLSQAYGKGIDLQLEHVDFATFAPQKIYGPKMVGLLYLRHPENFPDLSKDTHTKNLFLVGGMAKAFEMLDTKKNAEQLQRWSQQIEDFIAQNIPNYKIHEAENPRVPGLINVAFENVRGSELMTLLSEEEGICVSTGSACTTDIMSPTPIIKYIENDPTWQYPIRIGLHTMLQDEEVKDFCEILAHYVEQMRDRAAF